MGEIQNYVKILRGNHFTTYSNIPKRQNLEIEVNRIENIGNDEQEVK